MTHTIETPATYAPTAGSAMYAAEYDAIMATMQRYVDGGRAGKSELMRPGFLPDATMVGYAGGTLLTGSVQALYDWIDGNGPAPDIEPRYTGVDILDSVAVVRVEIERWSGNFAGADVRMSDAFTLVKTDAGWKIAHKIFHWHTR